MVAKFKIKKGDTVVVLAGREKGKSGEVIAVHRKDRRVLVRGVNIIKRHTRPSQISPGGIMEKEVTLHISNLAIADPKDGKPTRIGYRTIEDGRKVRFAKRSGEIVDR